MGKSSLTPQAVPGYEPPKLGVLGSVAALTEQINKKYGRSDGYMFMGTPITNASP